ncbi:MAG: DoxX family protein [Calditrichaeota bacterium]|nr:DoxX family protein [Calditrichota bacterium]HQU71022.1 DoxX family protein [Calditrichia bacterium]
MKNKILLVVCVLFGLVFLNGGLNKFFNYMPVPEDMPQESLEFFGAMMKFGWLLPLLGLAESVGGILFMIPKVRALGAVVIFPVMVGIVLTHIVNMPEGLPLALILFAINLWVLFEEREKYLPMIR